MLAGPLSPIEQTSLAVGSKPLPCVDAKRFEIPPYQKEVVSNALYLQTQP
jgi:hypothetical protein